MVLLRRARAAARIHRQSFFYRQTGGSRSILFRPVIRLALNAPTPVTRILKTYSTFPATRAETAELPQRRPAGVTETTLLSYKTFRREERSLQTFFQQIFERTRRWEERVSVRTRFAAKAIPWEAERAQGRPQKAASQEWWKAELSSAPRQPSLPAMNIDQIADTVLRQLDRRVGSWRERMGRM
jgi:hypothetical protein